MTLHSIAEIKHGTVLTLFLVSTRCFLNLDSSLERQMDIKTTLCVDKTPQDVIRTSIQRHFNIMDVNK